MSKYLNVFNTLAEYQAFSASTEYVQPNVALVKDTNVLYYDYGNNKPQADLSDYKGELQESSVGGNDYGKDAITKINYIPSGETNLKYIFQNWPSLKEVTCKIPDSVEDMNYTFASCSSLINAPTIPSGVTGMSYTFAGCSKLVTAPEIPSGVINMNYTFSECKSLVNAPSVIPNRVTRIDYAFYYCTSLVNAPVIPSGITDMSHTFSRCSSLVNAPSVIPNSVTSLYHTFSFCSSLVNVPPIPDSVEDMDSAFYQCSSLKELTLLPATPPSVSNGLSRCPIESIYVPDEAVDTYKTATGWSEFASKFKPLSEKPTK